MQELEQIISYQLKQKEHCLYVIGQRMKQQYEFEPQIRSGKDIIDSTILHECVNCKEQNQCELVVEERNRLGKQLEDQGKLYPEQFHKVSRCKKSTRWTKEASWLYEKEQAYGQMEQRIAQIRKMMGDQYMEASKTIGNMMSKDGQPIEISGSMYRKIQKSLRKYHMRIEKIYRVSHPRFGEQLYIFIRKKRKGSYQTNEIAKQLSMTLGERWKPLPRIKGGMLGFQLESKFHVLSGVISKAYDKKEKNGDNFSLYKLNESKYISMISDGMGTGTLANKDSKGIIESLEELLETGLDEASAMKCLQVMYSSWPSKERYSTLDYLQINLEAGVGIFLKFGACPSFLIRRGKIEMISCVGMPVGYEENHTPMIRKKLEADDLIVQISDGCIDGFSKMGIEKLMEKMEHVKATRPQKYVESLMHEIQIDDTFKNRDDMTMIALRIVDKY